MWYVGLSEWKRGGREIIERWSEREAERKREKEREGERASARACALLRSRAVTRCPSEDDSASNCIDEEKDWYADGVPFSCACQGSKPLRQGEIRPLVQTDCKKKKKKKKSEKHASEREHIMMAHTRVSHCPISFLCVCLAFPSRFLVF